MYSVNQRFFASGRVAVRIIAWLIVATLLWTVFLEDAAPLYADDAAVELVRCASFENLNVGGKYNNANLQLSLPAAIQGISLRFGEYGGNVNPDVNGDFRNSESLHDLDGATVGGVGVSVIGGYGDGTDELVLAGAISGFAIGGQAFYADQLCVFKEPFGDSSAPPQSQSRPDLGDAPDSTNHLGIAMEASSGVVANYPTVADAAALPAGPVHANPRPFHLGMLVSREENADVGPDADPTNNILPGRNQANRDLFDDGVHPPALVLSDCMPATIPVQIFVAPEMVSALEQGKGYLNIWVDGNRDGDWADAQQCAPPEAGSTAAVALEHIVVDFPVDTVTLGAGLHTVNVPTSGPVPWPAELAADPAWVRVTLSEKLANKPLAAGSLSYGDGRGYDDLPFSFGETEDYLWQPARDPKNGPDVAIRKEGIALPGVPVTMTVAAEGGSTADRIAWIIEYSNRGSETATGVEIDDDLALGGTLDDLEIKMEPELEYTQDGTHVHFTVGDLLPGKHGRIVLSTGADVQNSDVYTNVADIRAAEDADAENNRDEAVVTLRLRAPVIVEPGNGTTCENELTVRGRAVPGSTVDLYVDDGLVASPATDATGRWSHALTLADGEHTLFAVARLGALVSPASRTVNVTVNSSMAWNPLSLHFTNQLGWSHRPVDEEGRTDETGWSIRLRPGATYTVSVKLCCAAPSASVQLVISGTTPLELTDGDGDQIYSGVFTASEERHASGSMVLTVQCDDASFTGSGVQLIDPEGQVYDVKTSGTLAGAAVACLQAQSTATDAGATAAYDLWPATDYGQVNPQSTLADGQFNFFTPAGVYRLAVSRAGYQPYRSPDIAVVDEAVHLDVPLTPIVDRAANHVVVITDDGFEPAFLEVGAGEVVEWVNMGTGGHTATSLKAQAGAAAVGEAAFDSGLLLAGERYRFEFVEAGSYAVVDSADPANAADIRVVSSGEFLFLPAVRR